MIKHDVWIGVYIYMYIYIYVYVYVYMYMYVYIYIYIIWCYGECLKNMCLCLCVCVPVVVRVIWSPTSLSTYTHIWSRSLSYSSFLVIFLERQKAGWDPTAIPQSSAWASLGLVMWLSDSAEVQETSTDYIGECFLWRIDGCSILSRSSLALLLSSISLLFMKAQKTPIQKQRVRRIAVYLAGQLLLFISSSFGRKENKGLFNGCSWWIVQPVLHVQFSLYL